MGRNDFVVEDNLKVEQRVSFDLVAMQRDLEASHLRRMLLKSSVTSENSHRCAGRKKHNK